MSQKGDCWFLEKKWNTNSPAIEASPKNRNIRGWLKRTCSYLIVFWPPKTQNCPIAVIMETFSTYAFQSSSKFQKARAPPVFNQISDFKLTANLLSFAASKRVEILRSRLLLIVAVSDKLHSELRINASGAFLKHVPGMVKKRRNSDILLLVHFWNMCPGITNTWRGFQTTTPRRSKNELVQIQLTPDVFR